jgi:putative ABC transport system permease protein
LNGDIIDFATLADDEVLINEILGNTLDAQSGDVLTIVTPSGRHDFRLRAIMRRGGMAANDQRLLMSLSTHNRIYGNDPGTAARVDVSLDLDGFDLETESEAIVDELTESFTDAELATELHAGMQLFRDIIVSEIRIYIDKNSGTNQLSAANEEDLNEFIAELERDEPTDRFRILLAGDAFAGLFFSILSEAELGAVAEELPQLAFVIGQLERLSASGFKVFLTEIAEQVGNLFFTFFTFVGSFSVIVGLLLIFLIFVLLASERQQEMGIARAVGMKRGHLVQMFTFEGLAYAIGAAAVGTLIGVAVSRGIVVIMANAFGTADDESFSIDFTVTVYSILVAFSIGLILTLSTVIFSAYRVSRLNIVVAIRNLPEEFVASTTKPILRRILEFVFWIFGPVYVVVGFVQSVRRHEDVGVAILKLVFTLLIVGWLIGLIAAFFRIFAPYFKQGWPFAIIGVLLTTVGFLQESAWQAYIGASLTVYGLAMLALTIMVLVRIRETIATRVSYTTAGILILIIWALPQRYTKSVTEDLNTDIEMFIFAGVFMVASSVWIVMYNSDIIVRGLQSTFGRFTAVRPIMKPAVAYAVANRFRTGLTVAMFALVIFVLMSFSILNQSFSGLLQTPENVTGGFDVRAEISDELPIEDIEAAIDTSSDIDSGDFELIIGQSNIDMAARQVDGEEARFLELNVRGTEPEYFEETQLKITAADPSFLPDGADVSDAEVRARAVWEALADDPSLAVISDDHAIEFQGVGPDPAEGLMKLEDVDFGEEGYTFEAKEIEIIGGAESDASNTVRRTVIAVVDSLAESTEGGDDGGPPPGFQGIYTQHVIFDELSDEPVPFTIYRMIVAEDVDPSRTASTLQTLFLDNSMLAVDTEEELSTFEAQNQQFTLLFQGFMGLGLVVGVAALGVLALRAVNERRMQIAIMRAIGYRAQMIRVQFIMESIFITVIGTGLGMALGALISWSFLDDIGDANQGLTFDIPWLSISVVVAITIIAALITTYVPARQASQVYPAEALRYE